MPDLIPQTPSETPTQPTGNPLDPSVPRRLANKFLWLPDKARSMGIHIMAGKGSGKSRLMGRILAWLDFVRGTPLVMLDPNGPSIDNFLDKLVRLPKATQEQLWKRVIYVDMSGQSGQVVPFPLYYRLGDENLYTVSQRYLDVVRKVDPWLQTASVEGWNALWRAGTYTGMVLSALDCQITEAQDLLTNPEAWSSRFPQAVKAHPDAAPAVNFFTNQYLQWDDKTRVRRIDSFINKTAIFTLDPTMRAMFGVNKPGIDWQKVIEGGYAVLLDFRHEYDVERRRFKMLWAFNCFLEYIKHRGAGHRHKPVSLIVDELASLFNVQAAGANALMADLDELINVIARNYRIFLTLAHQELFQFDERTAKTLLSMGTQIFGSTSDLDTALQAARTFYKVDPYKVKRYEPMYGSVMGVPEVLDYRPIEFTIEEQQLLRSYQIKEQPTFHFLVRPAPGEGDATGSVYPVTIRNFDRDIWVDEELAGKARTLLSARCGMQVEQALLEIDRRSPNAFRLPLLSSKAAQADEEGAPDTINVYANNSPINTTVNAINTVPVTEGKDDRDEYEQDILREEKRVA